MLRMLSWIRANLPDHSSGFIVRISQSFLSPRTSLALSYSRMKNGQRAGLVGTNTIRQNYSREGGLDYIVTNGGVITDAVSTQVWSGEAAVYVSIANWVKGKYSGEKTLSFQEGNSVKSPFVYEHPDNITSALTSVCDVKEAFALKTNKAKGFCYQGQTHGHK